MTCLIPALAGCNVVYGMGMLESGLTMSYEDLLMNSEMVRIVRRMLKGIVVDRDTIVSDLIKEMGPGGSYLTSEHTLANMRSETYAARLADTNPRAVWQSMGSKTMVERANEEARRILETYKPVPLSADVQSQLHAIVEEAEEELREMDAFNAKHTV